MAELKVVRLDEGVPLPTRGSPGAAGIDISVPPGADVFLKPGEQTMINTLIAVEIPYGYYGQIAMRSSAAKKGLQVLGGIIDSDYRGPLFVLIKNSGSEVQIIRQYDKLVQLLVLPVLMCHPISVPLAALSVTARGAGGFGSTDAKK